MYWMLKLVEHNGVYQSDKEEYGSGEYKYGAIRIDIRDLDPAGVTLLGFQAATDKIMSDRGATVMGLYYKILNCSSVPTCPANSVLTAALSLTKVFLTDSQTSYSHSISLDSSASCIILEPSHFSVTHDFSS